jgi:hypothetical protein
MAKILVASGPDGQRLVQETLAYSHQLYFVSTLVQAKRVLADSELDPPELGVSF